MLNSLTGWEWISHLKWVSIKMLKMSCVGTHMKLRLLIPWESPVPMSIGVIRGDSKEPSCSHAVGAAFIKRALTNYYIHAPFLLDFS